MDKLLKPLKWNKTEYDLWEAVGLGGSYSIRESANAFWLSSNDRSFSRVRNALALAQEDAQIHYEKTIAELYEDTPPQYAAFEMKTYQVQFQVEIGQTDGGGMGIMQEVDRMKPFETKELAIKWLSKALPRDWKPNASFDRYNKGYGLAHIVRREISDKSMWVYDQTLNDEGK